MQDSGVDLSRRVFIVMGAGGRGIGEAASKLMGSRGASVMIVDVNAAEADRVAEEIVAAGGDAVSATADVTVEADVAEAVDRAVAHFGRLDGAFNNAGGALGVAGGLHQTSHDDFVKVIELNLFGTYHSVKHEVRALLSQGGGGSVVNNASALGLIGSPTIAAYSAGKHGVVGLTKSAAAEYGPHGIRFNAVCPGTTVTPTVEKLGDAALAHNLLGQKGRPQDVAEAVCFLLSGAARNVTGVALPVDGGWTAT